MQRGPCTTLRDIHDSRRVHAAFRAVLCVDCSVRAEFCAEHSIDGVVLAEKRASFGMDVVFDATNTAEIALSGKPCHEGCTCRKHVRHRKQPLPEWIIDLQERHKGATKRELAKVMNDSDGTISGRWNA
jgi:hypothetical protein